MVAEGRWQERVAAAYPDPAVVISRPIKPFVISPVSMTLSLSTYSLRTVHRGPPLLIYKMSILYLTVVVLKKKKYPQSQCDLRGGNSLCNLTSNNVLAPATEIVIR